MKPTAMLPMVYARVDKDIEAYKTKDGDAGYDMYATKTMWLFPLFPRKVPLNMKMEWKRGMFGLMTSRSGQSLAGNFVIPGIIDETYRGQMSAIMVRHHLFPKRIKKGERVAQLIMMPYYKEPLEEVNDISKDTIRGENGYGKSGVY